MLPVQSVYPQLVNSLKSQPISVLQAPPGAGKSTWLPLQLVRDNHFKRIIMLEPRRIAASNIAHYLAAQQGEKVGQSIGLRMRQQSQVSAQTRLEIVTEGVLTRMLQHDPELHGVDLIIFDEFHERSIAADTALAFALESQQLRDDLTLLIMSATLDTNRYQQFFHCPIIQSEGRSFPIEQVYVPLRDESRWLDAIAPLIHQALGQQTGSILVFLPGRKEIQQVAQTLGDLGENIKVHQLFAEQEKAAQQAAISPCKPNERKVVLTTNVAETSLTIEGVRVVIDSGKKRSAQFNVKSGVTQLTLASISRASAVQRAGRAGRLEAGVVYRLGSKAQFERKAAFDEPEILTSDLSQLVLEAKMWGTQLSDLHLLDTPKASHLAHATDLLQMLEVLDEQQKLTALGKQIHTMGLESRLAHMLIKAKQLESHYSGIYLLAIYVVALQESRIKTPPQLDFALHQQHYQPHGAFKKSLNFWLKKLGQQHSDTLATEHLAVLLALAFPDRLAMRRGKGWLLANGAGANEHSDYWHSDDFLAIFQLGGKQGQQIFSAVAFSPAQLSDHLGYLFKQKHVVEYDEIAQRFINETRTQLGALTISRQANSAPISPELKSQAWLVQFAKRGWSLFNSSPTSKKAEQLKIRLCLAAKLFNEQFPQINDEILIAQANSWLAPYLTQIDSISALQKFNYSEALLSLLTYAQQQQLAALLPTHIHVPSGANVPITYQLDKPAKLSVRMQQVYGLTQTPHLAQGKLTLQMELLSPAKRPLQLTQDLASFWQHGYKEVQKEMKGRYPKHFWPDNPASAQATDKIKSKM